MLKQVGSGKGGIDRAEALEGKFAVDSPVEDRGFELPVPTDAGYPQRPAAVERRGGFQVVAERTGLNAGCPSALFEEAAALYSLRAQRPDQNCKAVRKAWATVC